MIPTKGKLYKISYVDENAFSAYDGIAWCMDEEPKNVRGMDVWNFKLADEDSDGEIAMFTESDIVKEISTE